MTNQQSASSPRAWTLPLLFLLGLAISLLMVARVRPGPDAVCLLARGWLLADKGILPPLGAAASGGGYVPGGLTAVLVGVPLMLWQDHRSAVVLILLCHVAAYLLLDGLLKQTLDTRARIVFAIVYWLNPWRLHQSAWLDNTNYVFLGGAIHLWALYRLRHRPRFLETVILIVTTALTLQLHLDAIILVFAAVFLWLRGLWKPHWGGVAAGAAASLGLMVPFLVEAAEHPEVLPLGGGTPGFLMVWPPLKGLTYWFRYPSLWVSWRSMLNLDFTTGSLAALHDGLAAFYLVLGRYIAPLTVLAPLAANLWVWRRLRRSPSRSARAWLGNYAVLMLLACFVGNAISPVQTMWWHNLVAFHAAVLPLVLWAGALWRTRRAAIVPRVAAAWVVVSVVLLVGMLIGGEQFRPVPPERLLANEPPLNEVNVDLDLSRFGWWFVPRREEHFYRKYMSPYELRALEPAPTGAGPAPAP